MPQIPLNDLIMTLKHCFKIQLFKSQKLLSLSLQCFNSLGSAMPVIYPQSMLVHTTPFLPDLSDLELDNIPMNGKYTYVLGITSVQMPLNVSLRTLARQKATRLGMQRKIEDISANVCLCVCVPLLYNTLSTFTYFN